MFSSQSSGLEHGACQEQCRKHQLTTVITTYPEGRSSDNKVAKKEIAVPVETLSSSTKVVHHQ